MHSARLSLAATAALAVFALAAGPAAAHSTHYHPGPPPPRVAGALFVQTDGLAGNAVVAYDRLSDGTLRGAGSYATGGLGGQLTGSVVDHTASQGSLALDSGSLYAVNAGSDTITVFSVLGDRLVRRQVAPSGGSFPVSVAARGHVVYVLNARDGGSLQGYLSLGGTLLPVPGWHRALGLDPNATPEFVSTPGQVTFSPDGRRLLVTTKANSHSVLTFDVGPFGGISQQPTATLLAGTVPFSGAFDGYGHLALTEAGPSVLATFALGQDDHLTPLAGAATGQAATCWIVLDGQVAYVSNAGSGTISSYRIASDGTLTPLATTATHGGTVDATVSPDGRDLYVQTGLAGIVDAFRIGADGSLTPNGSVTVPSAVGGEGIVAS